FSHRPLMNVLAKDVFMTPTVSPSLAIYTLTQLHPFGVNVLSDIHPTCVEEREVVREEEKTKKLVHMEVSHGQTRGRRKLCKRKTRQDINARQSPNKVHVKNVDRSYFLMLVSSLENLISLLVILFVFRSAVQVEKGDM
ncbi:unnamed protein product, partial [Sphenostylis stenocarpa]